MEYKQGDYVLIKTWFELCEIGILSEGFIEILIDENGLVLNILPEMERDCGKIRMISQVNREGDFTSYKIGDYWWTTKCFELNELKLQTFKMKEEIGI